MYKSHPKWHKAAVAKPEILLELRNRYYISPKMVACQKNTKNLQSSKRSRLVDQPEKIPNLLSKILSWVQYEQSRIEDFDSCAIKSVKGKKTWPNQTLEKQIDHLKIFKISRCLLLNMF